MPDRKDGKEESKADCCCSPIQDISSGINTPSSDLVTHEVQADWVVDRIATPVGQIPVVSSSLSTSDKLGSWKARWGIGRMRFRVTPGLYAVGRPDQKSNVFVSANYKMSFDRLRSQLGAMDAWILVLDTRGINVWCAAGKGTFGTDEIVARIASVRLADVVSHRRLILPQLGAPGVSAHEVKKRSGFRVIYGPIRAEDIADFIEAGMKATPEMRRVRFDFRDRVVLIPVELTMSMKYLLMAIIGMILLSGFGSDLYSIDRVTAVGLVSAAILIVTYIVGGSFPPALLPWLPGRPFSIKGAWVGFVLATLFGLFAAGHTGLFDDWAGIAAWFCIIPAVISFQAMNFTGSSTYTSLSGVTKEMRVALPIQIGVAAVGVGLWITGLFL